jgi:hypothetical protein
MPDAACYTTTVTARTPTGRVSERISVGRHVIDLAIPAGPGRKRHEPTFPTARVQHLPRLPRFVILGHAGGTRRYLGRPRYQSRMAAAAMNAGTRMIPAKRLEAKSIPRSGKPYCPGRRRFFPTPQYGPI